MPVRMKTCFKCGVEKPLSEFYKHSRMRDGHLNKCMSCTKKDVRLHREGNLERIQEYDRSRPNRLTREYKERRKIQCAKWLSLNQDKRKAQIAAGHAVRDKKLEIKTECEHCCRKGKLQKHHWSYLPEHWLDVIWLCTSCHGKEHRRLNELGRDPDKPNTGEQP